MSNIPKMGQLPIPEKNGEVPLVAAPSVASVSVIHGRRSGLTRPSGELGGVFNGLEQWININK
jgi:hypothetical protein